MDAVYVVIAAFSSIAIAVGIFSLAVVENGVYGQRIASRLRAHGLSARDWVKAQ